MADDRRSRPMFETRPDIRVAPLDDGPSSELPDPPDHLVLTPEFVKYLAAKASIASREALAARLAADTLGARLDNVLHEVRGYRTDVHALGQLQHRESTETQGTIAAARQYFEVVAMDVKDLRAEIEPVVQARTQWGQVKTFAMKAAILAGSAGGVLAGVEKAWEIWRKFSGHG